MLQDTPIRRRLMTIILLTSGVALLLTCTAFFAYEFLTYRQATLNNLNTLGEVVARNSTASLAFANPDDAREVLHTLQADKHIVAAALYDGQGRLFAKYPDSVPVADLPPAPRGDGFRFEKTHVAGFLSVAEGNNSQLGTLYLRSDLEGVYARFRDYGTIAGLVILGSLLVAYLISRSLQLQISKPILALAQAARSVSERKDYSVRVAQAQQGRDELGTLNTAFNQMLSQIQAQMGRLELLNRITRAIGERQDLASVFQVVVRRLEDDLPLDFASICLYDPTSETLSVMSIGAKSAATAQQLGLNEHSRIPIDRNGLSRCVRGQLVYEPDIREASFAFPKLLASGGLRSLVFAPLLTESKVAGVLIAARTEPNAFSSPDCEFIRQLSEHVALASHQVQLYHALQQAYDDLRQSQHTVMQQERLRALGQMASGIAHDINNAISPVALYTESLLEREPNLSDKARDYLTTIQRAIEDVAETVARMREFYRAREPQLQLARVDMNLLIKQVLDLTHARWSDQAQQRGIVIELRTDLDPELSRVMGAETEIRDALTNLIFNAVDAMPEGGVLTLRTRVAHSPQQEGEDGIRQVIVEVSDSGAGMDEETRRRCLEPFFTTKGERGTGLGLPMVYGMVQRHSADLEIDSELGKGTTLRLIFPEVSVVLNDTMRMPMQAVTPQRLRLLIVDDDPLLIKSLRDTLEADGHLITAADGGQAGIDAFVTAQQKGQPFAAVITDLGMPYVDGRKVSAAIRAASPTVPIIMLTGWGQRLIAENDVPPHVNRVLNKPPRLQELRKTLAELTAGAPSG